MIIMIITLPVIKMFLDLYETPNPKNVSWELA